MIHYIETTDSTNRLAMEAGLAGASHGTAFVAKTQTAGRGRLGRSWFSSEGKSLLCSILVRPDLHFKNFPKLTLVAGIAVAAALEKLTGLQIDLKWPNDIYIAKKKCGGILTESSIQKKSPDQSFVVIGIGINCNHSLDEFPKDISDRVTSLAHETAKHFALDDVFHALYKELLIQISIFEKDGFAPFVTLWRQRDFMLGKSLTWVNVTGECVTGSSLGIDDEGKLFIVDEKSKLHEIFSGDIQIGRTSGEQGCE